MLRKLALALLLVGVGPAFGQVPLGGWPPPAGTIAPLCIYNSAIPSPTAGSPFFFQCDASGSLITSTTPPAPTANAAQGIAPSGTTTAAASAVLKASAGNLYDISVTIGATPGWVMLFDATTLPGNGATGASLKWCYAVNSDGTKGGISTAFNPPMNFATGITVGFSSTACNSLTASATAFFYGMVK